MRVPAAVYRRVASERERAADQIALRLDPLMSALGLLFVLVVLGETLAREGSILAGALFWTGWVLWAAFLGEFLLRMTIAPSKTRFLKRHGWQLIFLAVPFLRFVRLLRILRVGRAGRIMSAAVRGSRTATRALTGRLGWLLTIHAMVVLAASQLLFEFGPYETYAPALHGAALASVAGEPLGEPGAFAAIMEVLLALYAVVVFASMAGIMGAFLVERRNEDKNASVLSTSPSAPHDPGRASRLA